MRPAIALMLLGLVACRSDWKLDTASSWLTCTYYSDGDGDGYGDAETPVEVWCKEPPAGVVEDSGDCDDRDAAIHPGATEGCNALDDDCDGEIDEGLDVAWYRDSDGDGHGDPLDTQTTCAPDDGWVDVGDDCDDDDAAIHPEAAETCNGIDDDCDDDVDDDDLDVTGQPTWYTDQDSDGYGADDRSLDACEQPEGHVPNAGDCDDSDPAFHPGAVEDDCSDPNDYNCDGSVAYDDVDGDGWPACQDCDDSRAAINPDATERCDGLDNDCDGDIDEPDAVDASTWYADSDADGYGDPAVSTAACDEPSGYTADDTDCDDNQAAINPSATERCDGVDNDCDGSTDEPDAVDASTWYADSDNDGYGDAGTTATACDAPSGHTSDDTDCDDGEAAVNPGASERCDGVDNDCDGDIDEDSAIDAPTWYADSDGDGYGDPDDSAPACTQPSSATSDASDCDDGDAGINPDATEQCDGVDNDCDGSIDEPDAVDASTWYADSDGDGYGDGGSSTTACAQPSGHVADSSDCDDSEAAINPAASETCDGVDNDCDGGTDEDSAIDVATWYADADGDGYGDAGSSTESCDPPSAYTGDSTDCDDGDATINPGANELCDGVDNDCDGSTDEDSAIDASTWYADRDRDGYGDAGSTSVACTQPSGHISDDSDCDDGDAAVNPAATESCDGVDNDCDGSTDEDSAIDAATWYADRDRDSYGDAGSTSVACSQPSGHVSDASDCDDGSAAIHPGASELCDGVDNDCDGSTDEPDAVDANTWYADSDNDGYGDASVSTVSCLAPSGYRSTSTDCDDGDSSIHPGATELCNGVDDDCDGHLWSEEADQDGDGYDICRDGDCDDSDAGVGPDGDSDGDGEQDCWDDDDDDDDIFDEDELDGSYSGFVTDPLDPDTDGDGVDDADDPAPLTDACWTSLYFHEDFADDPSGTWTDISGTWSWDGSDTYQSSDTTAGANTWIGPRSWTDYVVEVVIRPDASSGDPGVMSRAQSVSAVNDDGESYYVGLYPNSGDVALGYQDGNWHELSRAAGGVSTGTWYTLQHRMSGNAHEVWLDGTLLISLTNGKYHSGSVGLRTYVSPASYDELIVCD
jgi:hypothetical protein